MINILATPSDNYTMPCGVMFYSACVNNPKGSLHFYVVTDKSFTDKNKELLKKTVVPFDNKIDFFYVDDEVIAQTSRVECDYYPKYVFYRLFAFKFLPLSISKVLYLDCDIIVRKPLESLWNIDISSFGIAGVPDSSEGDISNFNRLQYSYEKGYYNAGVLLMNLDYWRHNHVDITISEVLKTQQSRIKLYDQDVLNLVFKDSKKYIPIKYNVQSGFYYKEQFWGFEFQRYKNDFIEGRQEPVILHLSGIRPWVKGCEKIHPFGIEFYKYKDQTVWKDFPLVKRSQIFGTKKYLSIIIMFYIRKILGKTGLIVGNVDLYDRSLTIR